ncbi:MAG: S-layer homology domain-containing protein, partial [Clostridiales bacterium]|nr:S-layer homology domain-containing protein [Clostridiales bacterium]
RIAEIEIFGEEVAEPEPPDDPPAPIDYVNLAPSARISTDIARDDSETRLSNPGNLTDGDKGWTLWVTRPAPSFSEKFIQFDFDSEATVGGAAIFSDEGLGGIQGIRRMGVYAADSPDGPWIPVQSEWQILWQNVKPFEGQTLVFGKPVVLRSLRFVILDIYDTVERKFRISEAELYGKFTNYGEAVTAWEGAQSGSAKDYLTLYAEIGRLFASEFTEGLLTRLQNAAARLEGLLTARAETDNYLRAVTVTAETILHAGAVLTADLAGPGGFTDQISFTAGEDGDILFTYALPQNAPYGVYEVSFAGKHASAAYHAPSSGAEILSFVLEGVTAEISNNHHISAVLPYQTDFSALTAAFTLSENAALYHGELPLISGITKRDYTAPVTLTVIAEDHTEVTYTVTVTRAEKPAPIYKGGGGGGGAKGASFTVIAEGGAGVAAPEPPAVTPAVYDYTGHWAQSLFELLIARGVIAPDGDGNVSPNRAVSREEAAKILVVMLGISPIENPSAAFSDVPADAWYSGYVAAAAQSGLIQGVGGGLFGSGQSLSRQDAAVIICRALGLTASAPQTIADIDRAAPYARDALEALYEKGVMRGGGDGGLRPTDAVTRAELAAMADRVL